AGGPLGRLAGRRWRRRSLIGFVAALWIVAVAVVVGTVLFIWRPHPTLAQVTTMPPRPPGWPATLELGMSNGADGAASMRQTAPFGFRYQYLAGGVNTGSGWSTWAPDGTFVTNYIRESQQQRMFPVFTY